MHAQSDEASVKRAVADTQYKKVAEDIKKDAPLAHDPTAKLAYSEMHQDATHSESEATDISISRSGSELTQTEIDNATKTPGRYKKN